MEFENYPLLLLAYVGDAVFEVYVRTKLVRKEIVPIAQMHKKATRFVRASGQDGLLRTLEPYLTEKEADIVRRGRNTKSRVPKNADLSAYRRATGFEALMGWLHLTKQTERLEELLDKLNIGGELQE